MKFDVLIGKKIVKVTGGNGTYNGSVYNLHCSDGTIISVEENEGCGGCGNGWSDISEIKKLEEVENVITNVKYETLDDDWEDKAKLFVFYDRPEFNQTIEADEGWGNGYYGGGFYVDIVDVDDERNDDV